jgi:DNA gyrase/topoisomerase IV subunit B
MARAVNPGDPAPFESPQISEIQGFGGLSLRADSEQQQQQQQQQQHHAQVRRYLDLETMLPQEEIVTTLQTEIRTLNQIAPRAKG